jgi:putative flippase GtrA
VAACAGRLSRSPFSGLVAVRPREGSGWWQPRSHATRFTTFLAVGFCGLGTQLGVTALLYGHLHFALWLGAALAIQTAILVNFTANSLVTWHDRTGARSRLHRFLSFEGVSLVGLGINEGVLLTSATVMGIHYLLAVVCGAAAASLWNYGANSRFTFPASSIRALPRPAVDGTVDAEPRGVSRR